MTQLVAVAAELPAWPRSNRVLMLDTGTGRHYLVVTVRNPWRDGPFSMVYPIGATGTLRSVPGWIEGHPQMVTGGDMDMPEAIADLTQRLASHTIMDAAQSAATEARLIDADIEAFKRYITPNATTE